MTSLTKTNSMLELTSYSLLDIGNRPLRVDDVLPVNFKKTFHTVKQAKAYAEEDYHRFIIWHSEGGDRWTSGDMMSVMYRIAPPAVRKKGVVIVRKAL
jgi:hypothetical protein